MSAFTFAGAQSPGATGSGMPSGIPGIAGMGRNSGQMLVDASLLGFSDAEQRVWNFFLSQVARIEAEVYEIQYPDIRYQELVPVDTAGDPWMQSVVYFSSDRIGQAQWFNAGAQDVPLVQQTRNQFATSVQMAAVGYGFNEEELAIATRLGTNLQGDKAATCRRAAEEFIDRVALFGDTSVGFTGLFNSPGVTTSTAPADGTGSATTFASKTPTQILRDVNTALTGMWVGSSGIELADTLLLPQAVYSDLVTRARNDTSDTTIMQFLDQANIFRSQTGRALTVRGVWGLNTAGAGGTGRMIAYRRDPAVVKFHMPMPFQFRQPWRKGPLMFEVPGIFRLGGVDVKRPSAIRYVDGVA